MGEAPWASVFDPEANLRAVGEVQARGFRAASEVVDRFVRLASKTNAANAGQSSSEVEQNGSKQTSEPLGLGVDGFVGSWESLMGRLVQSLRGSPGPRLPDVGLDDHRVLRGVVPVRRFRAAVPVRRCGYTTVGPRIWARSSCDAVTCSGTTAVSWRHTRSGSNLMWSRCQHAVVAAFAWRSTWPRFCRRVCTGARCSLMVIPTCGCRCCSTCQRRDDECGGWV